MAINEAGICSALSERGIDAKAAMLAQCALLATELGMDAEALADAAEAAAMKTGADSITPTLLDTIRASNSRKPRKSIGGTAHLARKSLGAASSSSFEAVYGMDAAATPGGFSTSSGPARRASGSGFSTSSGAATTPRSTAASASAGMTTPGNRKRPRDGDAGSPAKRPGLMTPSSAVTSATSGAFSPGSVPAQPALTPSKPSSSSSSTPPPSAYASRTSAGQVVASFTGPSAPAEGSTAPYVAPSDAQARAAAEKAAPAGDPASSLWASGAAAEGGCLVPRVVAEDAPFGKGSAVSRPKGLFTTLDDVAASLDARVDQLGRETAGAEASSLHPTREPSQEEVLVAGRVVCDAEGEGRLNPASVLLEGSRRTSGGERVGADMMDCASFSLFPGQVVCARGMNGTGGRLVVREITHGRRLPLPATPAAAVEAEAARAAAAGSGPLRVWAAAGPFSLASDLDYQPLDDLLLEASQADAPPDALVLVGPFVDAEHPHVAAGRTRVRNADGNTFTLSARDVFIYKLAPMLAEALSAEGCQNLRVVLVPSPRDITELCTFPQGPMGSDLLSGIADESVRSRITLAPNPATFSLGGVVFGASSADVLFELNTDTAERHTKTARPARLPRLARHLLEQRSFYPLFPPGRATPLDVSAYGHVQLPVTPDVLLLPSKLSAFVADVDGCLAVGPGRLCKATAAGSYARLEIAPPSAPAADSATAGATVLHGVPSRTRARVMRI